MTELSILFGGCLVGLVCYLIGHRNGKRTAYNELLGPRKQNVYDFRTGKLQK